MPSDAKKERDRKKKEAAKQRGKQRNLKEAALNEGADDSDPSPTPVLNGPSSAVAGSFGVDDLDAATAKLQLMELHNANARAVAGVLSSHKEARDVKLESVTITFYGNEIVRDAKVELNWGRRYGLVGLNGSGKSTLLQAIARRELPIPDHFDIFLLSREAPASHKTALQTVIDVDMERKRLEHEAEHLAVMNDDESHERLIDVYSRLDEMDASTAEPRAANILHGLGFTHGMMHKACRDFSGGWRMRIALARALYVKPDLLLLDEPTNHLDLDACVWLEGELKNYTRILVIVSHSQDFMNGVCTNVIHLNKQRLQYYGGNYDTFIKTRVELMENQMKQYNWEQNQLQHMKEYVARFGHGSRKLARQAQSKEKTMQKMISGGLTEKHVQDRVKSFYFVDPAPLPPPVIMVQNVSFRYDDQSHWIYRDLDFGVDLDTRVALVGANGAGKTTLLKLLAGDLLPTNGLIRRHSHVKIGRYHQHLTDKLDLEMSALDWMQKEFPEVTEREQMRRIVGRYGLTGREQVCPMKQLSDGQRCRVAFSWLAWQVPHLLMLDEPTNHLDMESIDALADAINEFEGGMILVSHDFRLVHQVTDEIWVCEKGGVTKWSGDIFTYKEHLRKAIEREQKAFEKRQAAAAAAAKK